MGKEREIDALASEGIAASEKEFFAEAMGQEDPVQDETGDRSLEEIGKGLEGQHEPDDDEKGEGEVAEAKAETQDEPKAKGADGEKGDEGKGEGERQGRNGKGQFEPLPPAEHGMRKEMLAEREKRRAAETEFATYKQEMDRRLATLEARLTQAAQQAPQPKPEEQPKKDEIPDRWTEPEKYDRWYREEILKGVRAESQTQEQRRVAWSFETAKEKHGEAFDQAFKAANELPGDNPAAKQLVDAIMQSANPGERLVAWHRSQQAMREIGNDPIAYRERLSAETRESLMKDPEFRKQFLEAIKAEANGSGAPNDGGPRTTTKLPPSLSTARGGAPSRQDIGSGSDKELFEQVMG